MDMPPKTSTGIKIEMSNKEVKINGVKIDALKKKKQVR